MQILWVNNSRICRITNAKFSGYYFYMNTNISVRRLLNLHQCTFKKEALTQVNFAKFLVAIFYGTPPLAGSVLLFALGPRSLLLICKSAINKKLKVEL